MAVTYGNVFNGQFSVGHNDFVTALKVLFWVFLCVDRHLDTKSAALEQLRCRKADSQILAATFVTSQKGSKAGYFYYFESRNRYRNTGKR